MRAALKLLRSLLVADIRKAAPESFSGPVTPAGAILVIAFCCFGSGLLPAVLVMIQRSVVSLAFDIYLSFLLLLALALFPGGVLSKDEREFIVWAGLPKPVARRLELLHALALGIPLASLSALPLTIAVRIVSDSTVRSALVHLLCVICGLALILLFHMLCRTLLCRGQRLPVWILNLLFSANILCFILAIKLNLSLSLAGRGSTPGGVLAHVYSCFSGASQSYFAVIITAGAVCAIFLAAWHAPELPLVYPDPSRFSARSTHPARAILAAARAGRRSSFAFISGILALYCWRAPRLNLAIFISFVYGWSSVVGLHVPTSDLEWFIWANGLASFIPPFLYAAIIMNHDRRTTALFHTLMLNPAKLAFGGLVFSSLLSIAVIGSPCLYGIGRGTPLPVAVRGLLWLVLAVYVSHVLMQLLRPYLPLSQTSGRLTGLTALAGYIAAAQALSISSWYLLSHLTPQKQNLWALIIVLSILAVPLSLAAYRLSGKRLRHLSHERSIQHGKGDKCFDIS